MGLRQGFVIYQLNPINPQHQWSQGGELLSDNKLPVAAVDVRQGGATIWLHQPDSSYAKNANAVAAQARRLASIGNNDTPILVYEEDGKLYHAPYHELSRGNCAVVYAEDTNGNSLYLCPRLENDATVLRLAEEARQALQA